MEMKVKILVGTVLGATLLLTGCGNSPDESATASEYSQEYQEKINELESTVAQLEEENQQLQEEKQQLALELDDLMIEQDYEMEDESERLEEPSEEVEIEEETVVIEEPEVEETASSSVGGVNQETFAQLRNGMSIDEVQNIIGVNPSSETTTETMGITTTMIMWMEGFTDSITVMFTDGYATSITQMGL